MTQYKSTVITSTHITRTIAQMAKQPHMRCCYILLNYESKLKNPYNTVSVVTRIQVAKYGLRFSEGDKRISSPQNIHTASGVHPASHRMGNEDFSQGKSCKA